MGPGEFIQGIVTIEAAKAGVLFAAERRIGLIIDRDVVDMGHARHDATP